jgi:ABC-type antimicrobial peptide transport system permease subunit
MWTFFRNVHYSARSLSKSPSFTLALLRLAVGLAATFPLARVLRSLLFQVTPADPVTFVVVLILSGFIALAACVIPARGAMRLDPARALLINR